MHVCADFFFPLNLFPPYSLCSQGDNLNIDFQENIYTLDWAFLEKTTQQFNYNSMKDDFVKDPQLFLVNNILMSVQFFKNYER